MRCPPSGPFRSPIPIRFDHPFRFHPEQLRAERQILEKIQEATCFPKSSQVNGRSSYDLGMPRLCIGPMLCGQDRVAARRRPAARSRHASLRPAISTLRRRPVLIGDRPPELASDRAIPGASETPARAPMLARPQATTRRCLDYDRPSRCGPSWPDVTPSAGD